MAIEGLRRGDFSVRLRPQEGVSREVAASFNELAERLEHSALELAQLTQAVARDGARVERMRVDGLRGGWETMRDSFKALREQQGELRQLNAELEEKAARLSLSSRYKSEFLANMSHELRTPLNSVLILARVLEDNKDANLSDKQVEYARTIHAAGTDLVNLVNEVLDLSKVEAGRTEIDARDVPVQAILERLEQTFRPVAQQTGLELVLTVDPSVPSSIRTDGQRLQQILCNLVGNAFKFTERGGITVQVHQPPEGAADRSNTLRAASDKVIAISVKDTGIGIAKGKQEVIFDAFQQADGATRRPSCGTGLGLSISRELARLLGGEVRVSSEPGKGSTFTLLLHQSDAAPLVPEIAGEIVLAEPYEPSLHCGIDEDRLATRRLEVEANASRRERLPEAAMLTGRKVLVVDDDVRNVYALAAVLEDAGMRVFFAENGREGIEVLHATPGIGLVLMDMMMPEMDGYETMRRVRAMPQFRTLPLVALTAKAMKGDGEECFAAGASDYVTKPVNPDQLLSLMRVWFHSNES